ncbi:hypothetical protein OSB04_011509 [Centaurea solstitialis]|uniref:Uncharacterized protein n=1 Tax=Centaurea solstitialis TaxID=347529 RepID=A0AA38WLK3_9ASTR|nr:hypothetical protein OSB04_011509 [Centaurea solstitialis]
MALALWFYDACIPLNAVNSPLFPIAINKIANLEENSLKAKNKHSNSREYIYTTWKKMKDRNHKESIHKKRERTRGKLPQTYNHTLDELLLCGFMMHVFLLNVVNSPLFPITINKIANMDHGYSGPSYHAMRVSLLKDAKESVMLIVDSYKKYWK